MKHYAQLNENNICIGISMLSGQVDNPMLIPIDKYDNDYLFRRYEDGQWSEEKYEPKSNVKQSELDETKDRVADLEQAITFLLGGGM